MKFLNITYDNAFLIADVHLGVRNNSIVWQENISSYFDNVLIPLLKKNANPTSALFILGDLFDDRKSVSIDTLNLGIDIIEKISKIIPTYILLGNHDMFKKSDGSINSLRIFNNYENVTVIKEPTIITYGTSTNLLMLPHLGDVQEESKIVEDYIQKYGQSFSKDCPGIVFAHTDIAGLKYDNNKNINTGLQFNSKIPLKIYSGHIHKRQETTKVYYVGSPYHLRRSDIGNIKGVYHIDFNHLGDKPKFYKNTYSPEFKRVFYDVIVDTPMKDIKKIMFNNYIDIIINESELNSFNSNDLFQALEYCQAKKIEVLVNRNLSQGLEYDEENYKELTLDELIETNINSLSVDEKTKSELLKLYSYYNKLVSDEFGY